MSRAAAGMAAWAFLALAVSSSAREIVAARSLAAVQTAPLRVTRMRGSSSSSSATEHSSKVADALVTKSLADSSQGSLISWPGLQGSTAGPLTYQGGQLLTSPIAVHVIYYGGWQGTEGQAVLDGFVKSLSASSASAQGPSAKGWWDIATAYTDSAGSHVSAQVSMGTSVTVNSNYKTQLDDGMSGGANDFLTIVQDQISAGKLPLDSNAVYFVVTSGDIQVGSSGTGFCGASGGYCGWHSAASVSGSPIQFAFVGDSTQQCGGGCGYWGTGSTPNGFPIIDSLISTLAHELVEAATNPAAGSSSQSGGYLAQDQNGQTMWEDGDLCIGQFTDSTYPNVATDDNGISYNLEGEGGLKFMLQTNVDISKQECVLQGSEATLIPSSAPAPFGTPFDGAPAPSESAPPPSDSAPPPTDSAPPPSDSSPPPSSPPTPGGGGDVCQGGDLIQCSGCDSADGCLCVQGGCYSVCQVAAYAGATQQGCTSCGASSCACASDGTCQADVSSSWGSWLDDFFNGWQ